jgi:hypothetical protein
MSVLGDMVGCVLIGALTQLKIGLVLYLALGVIESILLLAHLVGPNGIMWLADVVPTILLCLFAITVVRACGEWRIRPDV